MTLPRHDPGVSPESEGIPDLGDSTPNLAAGQDPELESVAGDTPAAVEDFGTTSEEMFEGESLDGRLAREEADPAAAADPATDAVASGSAPHVGGFSAQELAVTVDDEFGDVL